MTEPPDLDAIAGNYEEFERITRIIEDLGGEERITRIIEDLGGEIKFTHIRR